MSSDVRWDAPGPGVWELETAHFTRPLPRFGASTFHRGFAKGFAEGAARFGLLLSHFQGANINGFTYMQPVPYGAPPGAAGPPPKAVLWLLTRLHPKLRARIAVCEQAFLERRWRDELRQWDEVDKPRALKRHGELLAVDVPGLDDGALAEHLAECEAHIEAMAVLHHRYTIPSTLPVGDLIAHVAEWTGESPGSILATLRGSTPVSKGILAAELEAVTAALQADAEGRARLERGGDPAATVADLSGWSGAVGAAARAFFEAVRHRAVSYELAAPVAGEMPDLLVATLRAAVGGAREGGHGDAKASAARLRERVPEAHRPRFDELVEEARVVNRLRDERGVYADGFAVGIARRAVMEAGRRLASRGRLHQPDHAVDLTREEAQALLRGQPGPGADETARHVTWRVTKTVADAPLFIGGEPSGPPDAGILPGAARRAARAIDAILSNLLKEPELPPAARPADGAEGALGGPRKVVIRGTSVNEGIYEGTARLITEASEFSRLQQGDVLVTRATAPYFNVVLPLLGAIVTDRGGQLCHAAIVAREYGIPGVVGTRDATTRIPDGARVRVDGTTGEVTVLGQGALA